MYRFEYYYAGLQINHPLAADVEVKTVGTNDDCHYRLIRDINIQPLHFMIRFVDNHFEICSLYEWQIDGQSAPLNAWQEIKYGQEVRITDDSVIKLVDLSQNSSNQRAAVASNPNSQPEALFIDEEDDDELSADEEDEIARLLQGQKTEPDESPLPKEPKRQIDIEQEITGKTIGERYYVTRKIGSGAMGEVYEVLDKELQRKIALKIFVYGDMECTARERFLLEAKAIGKLHHKNIVKVHDVGEYNHHPFYTMDLLNGKNIQELVQENNVQPRYAMKWVRDIASAIHAAHEANIIHRDIKPSNIVITKKGAILTDFGIAKDLAEHSQLTTAGETLGTPSYMSPEQAAGRTVHVNHSSDIYSLGAVLYEALTGYPPFVGNPIDVLQKVATSDPVPIYRLNRDVHPDAVMITQKAMWKEQRYRYATAEEMAEDIQRYLDGEPISGKLPPFYVRLRRYLKQNKAMAVCGLILIFMGIAAIAYYQYRNYRQYCLIRQQIEQYLEQAANASKKITRHTSLKELMEISELYTKVLLLSPDNAKALSGKLKITLLMASQATERHNLNFAKALYYMARQIDRQRKHGGNDPAIEAGEIEVDKLREQQQRHRFKQAEEVLQDVFEQKEREVVNEVALSLLRFPNVLNQLKEKYRHHKNPRIAKVFKLTSQCLRQNHKKIAGLDMLENMMVDLLPYGHREELEERMIEGLDGKLQQRIFSARILGLTRSTNAIPYLIKRIRYDVPDVVKYAMRSLLMLQGGENSLLAEIRSGAISLEKLQYGGKWSVSLLVTILLENPEQNFDKILPLLKAIKKAAVKPMVDIFAKTPTAQKAYLLKAISYFDDQRVLELLLKSADSYHEAIREAAIAGLGRTFWQHPQVRRILIKALDSDNERIRLQGISAVAKIKEQRLITKLARMLTSASKPMQQAICNTLSSMGSESASILIDQLNIARGQARLVLIQVLGNLKSEQAIDCLLPDLGSADSHTVTVVIDALAAIGRPALPKLFNNFGKGNVRTKVNILLVVKKIKAKDSLSLYLKAMKDESPEVSGVAISCLSSSGEKAIPILLQVLLNKKNSDQLWQKAAKALGEIGTLAIAPLMTAFVKVDITQRDRVARALIEIGSPALPRLFPLLKNEDPNIRVALAGMLGAFPGSEEVISALIQALSDPVQLVQEKAELSLGRLGGQVVPYLQKMLDKAENTHEKGTIVEILGKVKDKRALPLLSPLLADSQLYKKAALALKQYDTAIIPDLLPHLADASKRRGVTLALHYLGHKAIRPLMEAMLDREISVRIRQHIPLVLAYWRSKEMACFLFYHAHAYEDHGLRSGCWAALQQMGKIIVPYCIAYMTGDHNELGYCAQKYPVDRVHPHTSELLKLHPYYTAIHLIRYLKRNGYAHSLLADCARRLDGAQRSRLVHNLISLLRYDKTEVRRYAAWLLGELRDKRARPALQRALYDKDGSVRGAASGALGNIK